LCPLTGGPQGVDDNERVGIGTGLRNRREGVSLDAIPNLKASPHPSR
jgi:hypothetical protein